MGIGNASKYEVIRDTFAGTTILCKTGFMDVAEFVANETVKRLGEDAYANVYIFDTETGKSIKVR